MLRVYAGRVVARMTYELSFGYRTMRHLIGDAMREFIFTVNSEEPVSFWESGGLPFPAIVPPFDFNFLPKQFRSYHMNMIAGAVTCE
jgi:hypothetical protein